MLENLEKSTVKYSIEKTILLDFVNFSTIFCPKLHLLAGLLIRDAGRNREECDVQLKKDFAISGRASLNERVGIVVPTGSSLIKTIVLLSVSIVLVSH